MFISRIKNGHNRGGNIILGNNVTMIKSRIRIRGHQNKLIIHDGVYCGSNCSFWLEGDNNVIEIGAKTTFTLKCHINAQEGKSIVIGEDCMFANRIIVRTSDSHNIISTLTKERINIAKSIKIGGHVYVCPNVTIMKGVDIGSGSVIGSNAVVTKNIPENTLNVGIPSKVIKENVSWNRKPCW